MKTLLETFKYLPRHPFKLARALVRGPLTVSNGPSDESGLGLWTQRFPLLLIHPEVQVAAGIHALLRLESWRSVICTNANDGLQVAKAVPISLILIGPTLPDMSQSALIRDLATRSHSRGIPLVVLNSAAAIARPALLPRNAATLVTPFNHDELIRVVREMLLTQGNWRWPADYNAARAERAMREHVFAS